MLDVLPHKRGGLVAIGLSCDSPASSRRRATLRPNWMSVELRLGITMMLCHFARPASVDYRLQDEKTVEGRKSRVEGQKTEAGERSSQMADGSWKLGTAKGSFSGFAG